jgi:hypothetical protein
MQGLLIGLVAVAIGGALCFRGHAALRVVIAGVIAGATGEGLLASVLA